MFKVVVAKESRQYAGLELAATEAKPWRGLTVTNFSIKTTSILDLILLDRFGLCLLHFCTRSYVTWFRLLILEVLEPAFEVLAQGTFSE
jgi:hypothetical protein